MAAVPPPMIRYCAWFGISGKNFSSSCFLATSASTGTTVSVTAGDSVSGTTVSTTTVSATAGISDSEATGSDVSTTATAESGSATTTASTEVSALTVLFSVSSSPFLNKNYSN